MTSWRGLVPRSWVSVDDDTRQPSFTAPITQSSGTKTSSRNTSLKSDSPVICFSGRTSTPSARMSIANEVMPACFFTSGSVRARQRPQSANWAYDVQTFWPERRQPPSSRDRPRRERGQVAARTRAR